MAYNRNKNTYSYIGKGAAHYYNWGSKQSFPQSTRFLSHGYFNGNFANSYDGNYSVTLGNGVYGYNYSASTETGSVYKDSINSTFSNYAKFYTYDQNVQLSSTYAGLMIGSEHTIIDGRASYDSTSTNGSNNGGGMYFMGTYGGHSSYGRYRMIIKNIQFKNWYHSGTATGQHQNTAILAGNTFIEFYDCKFINTDLFASNYYEDQASTAGYPSSFFNCLFVNSKCTSNRFYNLKHCTFINSQIGCKYQTLAGENHFPYHEITDNFVDENSTMNFMTDNVYHKLKYTWSNNVVLGKIVVRRHGGDTSSTQHNPTGTTWANSVSAGEKTYDFRNGDLIHRDFCYGVDHFWHLTVPFDNVTEGGGDAESPGIWKPSNFTSKLNTSIFNISDILLGTAQTRGDVAIDYTLKTGTTDAAVNLMRTGSTDGYPIGCHAVAHAFNATNTVEFPTANDVGVTRSSHKWVLADATATGSVESTVIDMGESKRIKVNMHMNNTNSLEHGNAGKATNTGDYSNWNIDPIMSGAVTADMLYQDDVITNGDFTNGITGWRIHTSTSGDSKGHQGWQFVDGAMCLTAASYTNGATDPLYQGYSKLIQDNCFDPAKAYYVRVYFDHDHKLKAVDPTGYGQQGLASNYIYFHHDNSTTNYSTIAKQAATKIIHPYPGNSHSRYYYTNGTNRGARYPVDHFWISGATHLCIQQHYGARRERLTKVEAYEVPNVHSNNMGGLHQNMTFYMKHGATEAACNSASYKKYLFNTWCEVDNDGTGNGETSYQKGYNQSYVDARFVKLKIFFNNKFKNF